ncbi:adenosylcobinamide-GDP ribazoletransferase [Colwelliaceae bacterium 6441]
MLEFLAKRQRVMIRYQWHLFCLAVMFFTRIPVAKNLPYSEKRMNQANRYFSLVGILIGAIIGIGYCILSALFPLEIVVVLVMIMSVMLTGAFHEDGLADMADGIGGGYTQEKRLLIMKDSRIGTYGATALIMSLLLKFTLLVEIANHSRFIIAVILAYGLSRACAASLIFDTSYVSDESNSKSKPLAAKQSKREYQILVVIGLTPCIAFFWFFDDVIPLLITLVCTLWGFRFLFRRWIIARIGGFTGDCLGAAQQISELLIYLVIVNHLSTMGIN